MEAGDCVFFHPETIHGSGKNSVPLAEAESPEAFRKGIAVHYVRKTLELAAWEKCPAAKVAPNLRSDRDLNVQKKTGGYHRDPGRLDGTEFEEQTLAEMVKEFQTDFWKGSLLV